jgi:hypothetical protein
MVQREFGASSRAGTISKSLDCFELASGHQLIEAPELAA